MSFLRLSCWVSIASESHQMGNKEWEISAFHSGKRISDKGHLLGNMYSSRVSGTEVSWVVFTQCKSNNIALSLLVLHIQGHSGFLWLLASRSLP